MSTKSLHQEEFRVHLMREILNKSKGDGLFKDLEESNKWLDFHKFVADFQMPNSDKVTVDWDKLKDTFNKITGKQMRIVNSETKRKIKARLKEGYQRSEIVNAMKNAILDPYHIETSHRYITLEYFSRAKTIDKYQEDLSQNKSEQKFTPKSENYER